MQVGLPFARYGQGRQLRNEFSVSRPSSFLFPEKIRARIVSRVLFCNRKRQLKDKRRKFLCRQNQRNSKWPQAQRWLPREANVRSPPLKALRAACTSR